MRVFCMQSHVVTWLENLHVEVTENICAEVIFFAQCHVTKASDCSLAASSPRSCRSISKQAEVA